MTSDGSDHAISRKNKDNHFQVFRWSRVNSTFRGKKRYFSGLKALFSGRGSRKGMSFLAASGMTGHSAFPYPGISTYACPGPPAMIMRAVCGGPRYSPDNTRAALTGIPSRARITQLLQTGNCQCDGDEFSVNCGHLSLITGERKVKKDIVFVLAIVGVVAVISLGVAYFLT